MKHSNRFILFVLLLVLQSVAYSQAGNKKKIPFQSFNSLQVLAGKSANSLSIHSVNGLQYNRSFAGIGAGLDFYYQPTIPLFLELRQDITKGTKKLQAFVNGGMHIPYSNENKQQPFKTGYFKAGRLFAIGFDYYVPAKTNAIVIGVAYSQKKITQMVDNNIWNPALNRTDNVQAKDMYEFNRIWMKLGWVF